MHVYALGGWRPCVCCLPTSQLQPWGMAVAWEGSWGCSFLVFDCPLVLKGPGRPGHSPAHSDLEEKCACCVEWLGWCLCEPPLCDDNSAQERGACVCLCVYTRSCGCTHTRMWDTVSLYVCLLGLGNPRILKAEKRGKTLKGGFAVHLRMIWELMLSSHS